MFDLYYNHLIIAFNYNITHDKLLTLINSYHSRFVTDFIYRYNYNYNILIMA